MQSMVRPPNENYDWSDNKVDPTNSDGVVPLLHQLGYSTTGSDYT